MSSNEIFPGKSMININNNSLEMAASLDYKINGYAGGAYFDFAEIRKTTGDRVISFRAEWTVPSEPKSGESQVIFIFNGLQTRHDEKSNKAILQPVLLWRKNEWFVSSYYVNGTPDKPITVIANTRPIKVNCGDKIVGLMTSTKSKYGFYYSCEFDKLDKSGLEIVSRLDLCNAIVALESYAVSVCEELPGSAVNFKKLELESSSGRIKPSWNPVIPTTECGIKVNIGISEGLDEISIRSAVSL